MTEQARDTEALIRDQIAKHPVLLYMKGTPQFPQCGFSARAVEALSQIGRPFAYVNILENPDATLPKFTKTGLGKPTIMGGSDCWKCSCEIKKWRINTAQLQKLIIKSQSKDWLLYYII